MSLDWDTDACDPPLPATTDEADIRRGLIWATMAIDLGSITEKNADEWVFRLFHQKRLGLDCIHFDDAVHPSEVEGWVRRWIGLVTNVASKPRKQWLKRCCEILEKRTVEQLQYYKRQAAEAL